MLLRARLCHGAGRKREYDGRETHSVSPFPVLVSFIISPGRPLGIWACGNPSAGPSRINDGGKDGENKGRRYRGWNICGTRPRTNNICNTPSQSLRCFWKFSTTMEHRCRDSGSSIRVISPALPVLDHFSACISISIVDTSSFSHSILQFLWYWFLCVKWFYVWNDGHEDGKKNDQDKKRAYVITDNRKMFCIMMI